LTKTIQYRSRALLSEAGNLTINNPETENNMGHLLLVVENLNKLYKALNRLDYALKRQDIELSNYCKYKGEHE